MGEGTTVLHNKWVLWFSHISSAERTRSGRRRLKCSRCSVLPQSLALSALFPRWLSGTRPDTNTPWSCQEIGQTPVPTCRGGTALCRNAAKNEGRKDFHSGVLTRVICFPFQLERSPPLIELANYFGPSTKNKHE